jgi:hypothetical protein
MIAALIFFQIRTNAPFWSWFIYIAFIFFMNQNNNSIGHKTIELTERKIREVDEENQIRAEAKRASKLEKIKNQYK